MKWRKVLHNLWIDIKCIFYWLFLTYLEVTDNLKYTLAGSVTTSELVNLVFNFIEVYSGRTLYPYQEQFSKRVIRSVLTNDGAEITALFARQSGKSETISDTSGGMMILLPQLANMPMFAMISDCNHLGTVYGLVYLLRHKDRHKLHTTVFVVDF